MKQKLKKFLRYSGSKFLILKTLVRVYLVKIRNLFVFYERQKSVSKTLVKGSYQHEFVMLTCSYKRDLERCFNAYQSFENFFVEEVPYYICVPENDLEFFESRFNTGISDKKIEKFPIFMTESELMRLAGEPADYSVTMPGYYLQDALRLSFGLTGISRHYFMNDSDGYFIKKFSKDSLYKNGQLMFSFHEVYHNAKSSIERETSGFEHGNKEFMDLYLRYYDIERSIKCILKSDSDKFSNYTCTPTSFDSDIIKEMRGYIVKEGFGNFTNIIRMVPFAFQWYGEYLMKTNRLIPQPFLFFTVEPHIVELRVPPSHFDDPLKVGIQYQSVDYSGGSGGVPHDRVKPEIIFISETNELEDK